jgi:hypothetical protein
MENQFHKNTDTAPAIVITRQAIRMKRAGKHRKHNTAYRQNSAMLVHN